MKRVALALLVACLAASAWAGKASKPKARVVDGKIVIAGPAFRAAPLVDVRDLKFYACTLQDNKAYCTVITGQATTRTAEGRQYVVTIDINLYEVCGPTMRLQWKGVGRAIIDRPKPNIPARFTILTEAWYADGARGTQIKKSQPHYTISINVRPYKPAPLPKVGER